MFCCESVANTVFYRCFFEFALIFEVFIWRAQKTRGVFVLGRLKSNVTKQGNREQHCHCHGYHRRYRHRHCYLLHKQSASCKNIDIINIPPSTPSSQMPRAERETVHVSRIRIHVISPEVKYTWKSKLACAKSREWAQWCPEILGKHRKTRCKMRDV